MVNDESHVSSEATDLPLLVVAPEPGSTRIQEAGGLVTTSIGLDDYARRKGLRIDWIDTSQSNFPPPSVFRRTLRSLSRLAKFAWVAATRRYTGAVIYGGAGLGFFERSAMVLIAKVFDLRTARFIVDGHIVSFYEKQVALRPLIDWLLKAPDIVGLQGESWRTFYEKAGVPTSQMRIVRNWVRRSRTASDGNFREPSKVVHFASVGWLVEEKGVRELIAAARILAARGADFRLTIIGGGALLKEVEATISHEEFGGRVSMTGWLAPETVSAHLESVDVLVHPSYAEGLPNALLEAMVAGAAAIATPVGAIPDVLKEGYSGHLVPPRDAKALADAMHLYCDKPELARTHGEHGAQFVRRHHDLDANCAMLFGLFDEFGQGKNSAGLRQHV